MLISGKQFIKDTENLQKSEKNAMKLMQSFGKLQL